MTNLIPIVHLTAILTAILLLTMCLPAICMKSHRRETESTRNGE